MVSFIRLLVFVFVGTDGLREGNRLFEDLLRNYRRLVRPVRQPSEAVRIQFKFKLLQILDVHEKDQVLRTSGLLQHIWTDYRLSWNPIEYGNLTMIHIPGERIWLPDIILYNNADGRPTPSAITKADVYYNGSIFWTPPATYSSLCLIDTEWFPYDEQLCMLKFGSWTYSGEELDVVHSPDQIENITLADGATELKVDVGIDITEYQESVEFDLLSVVGRRHERYYPCCDFPAIDITYDMAIRRKKLFYTVNLMIPCIGIAMLASFVFYLPSESHNKITLCISVFVSLTIEIIPPTSTATPLIGKYLIFTMIMVTLSVALTVLILDIHHRDVRPMPAFIRHFLIDFLGNYILIYKRPSEIDQQNEGKRKRLPALNALRALEDHFKSMEEKDRKIRCATLSYPTVCGDEFESKTTKRRQFTNVEKEFQRRIRRVINNIIYIEKDIKRQKMEEDIRSDWRFVAMVVDRLMLFFFSVIILSGTLAATMSAPSLRDNRIPITMYFPTVIMYDDY